MLVVWRWLGAEGQGDVIQATSLANNITLTVKYHKTNTYQVHIAFYSCTHLVPHVYRIQSLICHVVTSHLSANEFTRKEKGQEVCDIIQPKRLLCLTNFKKMERPIGDNPRRTNADGFT